MAGKGKANLPSSLSSVVDYEMQASGLTMVGDLKNSKKALRQSRGADGKFEAGGLNHDFEYEEAIRRSKKPQTKPDFPPAQKKVASKKKHRGDFDDVQNLQDDGDAPGLDVQMSFQGFDEPAAKAMDPQTQMED